MARSDEWPPAEVRDLAARQGLGGFLRTESAPRFPASCGSLLLCVALAGPGIGLLLAGRAVPRAIGAVLLLAAVALVVLGIRRDGREEPRTARLHCYEQGSILARPEQGLEVHLWQEVLPYEWVETGQGSQGGARDHHRLQLRTAAGRELFRFAEYDVDRVADLVAAVELPRAGERIDRGEAVGYGRFTLTGSALTVDGDSHPWERVHSVEPGRSTVEVFLRGRVRPVVAVPAAETPHLRTLLALVEQQVALHPAPQPPPGRGGPTGGPVRPVRRLGR
ncbi:hypothetical protein ACIQGZ_24705 [Streptomyces sp. NPDC092296]|uniref:hypothetical protein n=1 Tax=Streptomyces sp. NPDC092296 TaxID=3366012 RepID=UPI00381FBEFD